MATQRLGRYDLIELIGRGGMAEVWRACARGAAGFSRPVALKLIRSDMLEDTALVTMFVDEACLSAKLLHPNIVATHDFGFAAERYYIALELIDGISLREWFALPPSLRPPLSVSQAAYVVAEVAAALDYAYSAALENQAPLRIVHRDISPANVMITTHGQVKLTDFGIAKAISSKPGTQTGVLKGKISYMSPEQARGALLDGRSDLYALGLVFYELITGARALRGDNDMEVLENARHGRVTPLTAPLAPPVVALLARLLQVDPAARHASAAELRRDLLRLVQQPTSTIVAELSDVVRAVRAVVKSLPAARRRGPLPSLLAADDATEQSTDAHRGRLWPVGRWLAPALIAALGVAWLAHPWRRQQVVTAAPIAVAQAAPAPVASARNPPPAPPRSDGAPPLLAPLSARATVHSPVRAATTNAVRVAHTRAGLAAPAGETATVRIQVVPWANVRVDGKDVGMTPLPPLELAPGRHEIVFRNPQLGSRSQQIMLNGGETRLVELNFALHKP